MKRMLIIVVAVFFVGTATAQPRSGAQFCRMLDILYDAENLRLDEVVNQLRDAGFPEVRADAAIIDTLGQVSLECYLICRSSKEQFGLEYMAIYPKGAIATLFIQTDSPDMFRLIKGKIKELKEGQRVGVEIVDESEEKKSVGGSYRADIKVIMNWIFAKCSK